MVLGRKIVSEYDQEIPQSQTADNPVTSRGRAAQPSREAVSIVFIVGSQLKVGEGGSSCTVRGRYDIIWNFDRRKVIDCLEEMC